MTQRIRFRVLSSLLLTLGLLAGGAQAAADEGDRQPMEDRQITWAVERELLHDEAVPSNRIAASTSGGIVTLIGSVDNVLAKDRAAGIAGLVKGVRAVVNDIKVHPRDERTDASLEAAVEQALLEDPATDSYEIAVEAEDGHLTLTGNVDSWQEKHLSERVARSVSGVTGSTNDIVVDYDRTRSDREIAAEIEESMAWDALIDDGLVRVEVENRTVTLTGTVGSVAERQRARMHAWTAGVREVDDSALDVARWARDEDLRADKYVVKSDDEIEKAASQAMSRDPRVRSYRVEVGVEDGVATLTGIVDNLKARRAARQDVENTVGVFSVVNLIKVRAPEGRADRAVETDVKSALLRSPSVDRYEISVAVDDGVATLSGVVDSYFEKGLADDLAARTKGVEMVQNDLVVRNQGRYSTSDPLVYPWRLESFTWYDPDPTPTYLSDRRLERAVEDELFWSPFVSADEITVHADDGVVTLEGEVDSWREWGAARDNALQAGAVRVKNRVTVEGGA